MQRLATLAGASLFHLLPFILHKRLLPRHMILFDIFHIIDAMPCQLFYLKLPPQGKMISEDDTMPLLFTPLVADIIIFILAPAKMLIFHILV